MASSAISMDKAAVPLHEGRYVGVAGAGDEVALPVPGHRAIVGLGGPLTDWGSVNNLPATLTAPGLRGRATDHAAGPQVLGEVALERAAGPGRTATGKSSRATPASLGRSGTPRAASLRFPAATIADATCQPRAAAAADWSRAAPPSAATPGRLRPSALVLPGSCLGRQAERPRATTSTAPGRAHGPVHEAIGRRPSRGIALPARPASAAPPMDVVIGGACRRSVPCSCAPCRGFDPYGDDVP